ncbi:hypothetical protein BT96DRAFT_1016013 [Gymnopus androsaceus JB14]|uniref:Uncharacterized protein n=1 Tax=Gymnopus androsaceus JB14 TaxID=1447944 RepID=A0A6A4I360_9AGAR|nr:hypothetical protein BT96DRAFT_1016013 [Gymnopus androsaceus JB14]
MATRDDMTLFLSAQDTSHEPRVDMDSSELCSRLRSSAFKLEDIKDLLRLCNRDNDNCELEIVRLEDGTSCSGYLIQHSERWTLEEFWMSIDSHILR